MGMEEFVNEMCLVKKTRQVALFTTGSHAGQCFSGPRYTDGADSVRLIVILVSVIFKDDSVCEVSRGIQKQKHGAFDAAIHNEKIVR